MNISPKAIVNITVFILFLVGAILLGDWSLSFLLQKPVSEIPTILKTIVHGISLTVIFYVFIKWYNHQHI